MFSALKEQERGTIAKLVGSFLLYSDGAATFSLGGEAPEVIQRRAERKEKKGSRRQSQLFGNDAEPLWFPACKRMHW